MKLLHVNITGWTATFRLPLAYSGPGLTSPLPPYSTLLGLIGSVCGREVKHNETRIGYTFSGKGTATDMETSHRLKMENGILKEQKQTAVAKRQFIIKPALDIYLDNLEFKHCFEYPQNPPCLGRSQDIAWVTLVEEVDAEPISEGIVRGTLVPFSESPVAGLILPLPDYFNNSQTGFTREIGKLRTYVAVKYNAPVKISRENLYKIGNDDENIIFMNKLY
ncbi:MAG: CRISPR-associated protein Cas5 [Nanoarchaeota archaeon]